MKATRVGSPAVAGNPIAGQWLPAFMSAAPKIDFIAIHWYKGANAKKFIKDLTELYHAYKKPILVTEYAPQTSASSRENPTKYAHNEVDAFVRETTQWMEQSSFVERYAWHDSKIGTSSLFKQNGELTRTGRTYSMQP